MLEDESPYYIYINMTRLNKVPFYLIALFQQAIPAVLKTAIDDVIAK